MTPSDLAAALLPIALATVLLAGAMIGSRLSPGTRRVFERSVLAPAWTLLPTGLAIWAVYERRWALVALYLALAVVGAVRLRRRVRKDGLSG